MQLNLTCPACSAELAVNHQLGMTHVECPECSEQVDIPDLPESAAAAAFAPLAFVAACVAGLVGAGAWALLSIGANFEIGYLAWAIGGLVGLATVKLGGRGTLMAGAAAAIVLLSIFGGKYIAVQADINSSIEEATDQSAFVAYIEEMTTDSEALKALGENPTNEQLAVMMHECSFVEEKSADVTDEQIADFREYNMPDLITFDAAEADYAAWSQEQQAWITLQVDAAGGIVGFVGDDLGAMDLIFLLLGITTAFGMVSKAA